MHDLQIREREKEVECIDFNATKSQKSHPLHHFVLAKNTVLYLPFVVCTQCNQFLIN